MKTKRGLVSLLSSWDSMMTNYESETQKIAQSMSAKEIQDVLGISKGQTYWLLRQGCLPYIMVQDRIRVMNDDFETWYASQMHYKKVNGEPPGKLLFRKTYSIDEVAEQLNCSIPWTNELIRKTGLPSTIVGDKRRFDKEQTDQWIQTIKQKRGY